MNRLSFLKTIGVGIAAAVITPKVLAEIPVAPKEVPKDVEWGKKWAKEIYAHYEEDHPRLTVDALRLNDLCIDREERSWLCTAMGFGMIELTALLAEPQPNFIEVKRDNFDEYFFIGGSMFSERSHGMPTSKR